MIMEKYEKPMMKFVSLRNESKVAASCWAHHGSSTVLYCDIPGTGYMSFRIGGSSCDLKLIDVRYHEHDDDPGAFVSPGEPYYEQLESILTEAGGKNGNAFKGMNDGVVVPDAPEPEWS